MRLPNASSQLSGGGPRVGILAAAVQRRHSATAGAERLPNASPQLPLLRTPVRRENNMYIFSGNATILKSLLIPGTFGLRKTISGVAP